MKKIDPHHYERMLQGDPDQFTEDVVRFMIDQYPEQQRGIPLRLLWRQAQVAIRRARNNGLETDAQIISFVGVMHEINPNFDEEPTLSKVLRDPSRSAEQRWDALFEDRADLNAAWERAGAINFSTSTSWCARADEEDPDEDEGEGS